jgi:NifB/MoaA-like Fe-S oxidoreductase
MVGFAYGASSKQINGEWQDFRREAEQNAMSLEEFSDIDIRRYDLEELDFGRYVDRTYIVRGRPIRGEVEQEEGFDLRELDTR